MRILATSVIALLLCGLWLAACALAEAPAKPETPPAGPAQTRPAAKADDQLPHEVEPQSIDDAPAGGIVHFKEPSSGRPFSYYAPKEYDRARLYPLLIECTGEGLGRKNLPRVWQLADKFNLIVASADTWAGHGQPGHQAAPDKILKGWSREDGQIDVPLTVRGKAETLKELRADAEALAGLVALLEKTYSVNRRAVVLTGYSGGAWVAYYAGLSDPARYAGICIRSGSFCEGVVPANFAPARKMPIQVVLGDGDLDVVLEETAAAERFFKANKFENFQVERLPHSGHDSRPEVAANFVGFQWRKTRDRLRDEMRPQYERCLEAGRAAVERGDPAKAREWFDRAARLERELELPARAAEELKKLDGAAGATGRPAPQASPEAPPPTAGGGTTSSTVK